MFILELLATYEFILLAAAVIPAIAILVYVYKKDSYEREPASLLLSLIGLGILSTLLASLTEKLGIFILDKFNLEDQITYNFWQYFVIVGMSEEGFKYLFMRKKTWNHPAFNCSFDGVVYAVFTSLGFAILENILYTFNYGFTTALVRAVTAIPGHACFAVFMGVFYAAAKKALNRGQVVLSAICEILAFVVPVIVHGLYDFAATTTSSLVFVGVIAVLFLVAFLIIKRSAEKDRDITTD